MMHLRNKMDFNTEIMLEILCIGQQFIRVIQRKNTVHTITLHNAFGMISPCLYI